MMRDLAGASIVLLKNDRNVLPLKPSEMKKKKIAVIGPNAKARIVSGGGSASLKASYFITPYDGIAKAAKEKGVDVVYHAGIQG